MKMLPFFLLLFFYPALHQAQICSANPGGDQVICKGSPITLYGENSNLYLSPLQATWTASPNNPSSVQLANPNALVTDVITGSDPALGVYEFELCVVCVDHELACETTQVTIGEIENPPMINRHPEKVCGNSITLTGSVPDPNVTTNWSINPSIGVSVIENGNTIQITSTTQCEFTVTYTQSIGSCVKETTTQVSFIHTYPNLTVAVTDPGCPSCSRTLTLCGSALGCGGTPIWSVVDAPPGVNTEDIVFGFSGSRCISVTVPADGDYCFGYTVENGECETSFASVCCTVNLQPGFGVGPGERFITCDSIWDLESHLLSVNHMDGVEYQWNLDYSNLNANITFSDPNSSTTNVLFDGVPENISENGGFVRVSVTAKYMNCVDIAYFYFNAYPSANATVGTIPLLCGGDPNFRPWQYLNIQDGTLTSTQIKAIFTESSSPIYPVGYTQFIGSTTSFNLTSPGVYSLDIEVAFISTNPFTLERDTCFASTEMEVIVAEVPTINAGSDIITCLRNTQLNGNTPIDINGNPVDIPVNWEQVDNGAPDLGPIENIEDPFLTDLQPGETYLFRYYFSEAEDCLLEDFVSVTVLPKRDCPPCELSVTIQEPCEEGCTTLSVSGADTYLWQPSTGIDDPTSATPTICSNAGGTYLVFGFVDGEECASELVTLEPCPGSPIKCSFDARAYCTTCSCGDPIGGMVIYDSNGNTADPSQVSINWTLGGFPTGSGANPFLFSYSSPKIVSAHIQLFGDDGVIICDTTISREVVCDGDCPTYQILSCDDEIIANGNYPECSRNEGGLCMGYGGYIFLVDAAGNLVTNLTHNAFIDWNNDGVVDGNPYLWTYASCEEASVRVWSFDGCDQTITYTPECCTENVPDVQCYEDPLGAEVFQIFWPENCSTEYYEVEMVCADGSGYFFPPVYIDQISQNGYYTFSPEGFEEICNIVGVHVRGFCSATQTFGAWSNCILFDRKFGCIEMDFDCCLFGRRNSPLDNFADASSVFENYRPETPLLYPNPASQEKVYLKLDQLTANNYEQVEVRIMDSNGKLIRTERINELSRTHTLSIGDLTEGFYYIGIYTLGKELLHSTRLIKTKGE